MSAIYHIFIVMINLDGEWSTAQIREIGGKGSDIEALGLSIFWVFLRNKKTPIFSKSFNRIYLIVAILSIILYLSRTTFIAIILFLISFYGVSKLTGKQGVYLLWTSVFLTSFYDFATIYRH